MATIKDKDLPARMKMQQNIAHQIAQQAFEQTWNFSIKELIKRGITEPTGNDSLSYVGTILCDFAGRWMAEMDKIRIADEAGIPREDLIKDVMNGILATIGCSAEYEQEKPLPNGIKRL